MHDRQSPSISQDGQPCEHHGDDVDGVDVDGVDRDGDDVSATSRPTLLGDNDDYSIDKKPRLLITGQLLLSRGQTLLKHLPRSHQKLMVIAHLKMVMIPILRLMMT